MHIKTLLQMLNSTEKVETTDLTGNHFKNEIQSFILEQANILFPELDIIYNPGGKWSSKLKTTIKQ